MADQPARPHFIEADEARPAPARRAERHFLTTLDPYLLVVVGGLLAIGLMMVYSTTFDWSYQEFGSDTFIFVQHVRNIAIGGAILIGLMVIDYRVWRRFAVWLLLIVISMLVAVLLFGDDTFGARRALINGSLQPGEAAELVMVIYMAAWLSSRRTRIRSITYGLIPFAVLLGIICGLVLLQPDLSTAAIIFTTSATMFFLAGADLRQITLTGMLTATAGWLTAQLGLLPSYAQERIDSFVSGVANLTQAHYQVQQAAIAFRNGGWTGVGLGEGWQKFGALPAPHTDSIFAVIGEELGVIGAGLVVALYIALAIRGFQIARRANDPFGALLASGLTVWIVSKAMLNIAVMVGLVPPTGAPLPYISYGGSSLVVLMAGAGLLISVARVRAQQTNMPERRSAVANHDSGGRDRRPRVSRSGRSGSTRHISRSG